MRGTRKSGSTGRHPAGDLARLVLPMAQRASASAAVVRVYVKGCKGGQGANQVSARVPSYLPWNSSSGAMYSGVPQEDLQVDCPTVSLLNPKSHLRLTESACKPGCLRV